jgi:hypothetical protein
VPDDVDPEIPLIEVRGDNVIINLPNFPGYRVLGVEISGETVTISTTLFLYTRRKDLDGWPGMLERANLVVLEVDGLKSKGASRATVVGEDGRAYAPVIGLPGAVAIAEDHAATGFGRVPPFWSLCLDLTGGKDRLIYFLGFDDSQTIDRSGENAVSGDFIVDAETGEVVSARMTVMPLGSTRQLASGCRLLGWTPASEVLAAVGSSILTYDITGRLLASVDTGNGLSGTALVTVEGTQAWLKGPKGCIAVDLTTGQTRTSTCPEVSAPAGTKTRTQTEKTVVTTLQIEMNTGLTLVTLQTIEDRVSEGVKLIAEINRDAVRTQIDTSEMKHLLLLDRWAIDDATQTLYFSTDNPFPSYGSWQTDHGLGALDVRSARMRWVAYLPGGVFSLSPCGRWAVYDIGGRLLIVNLRG